MEKKTVVTEKVPLQTLLEEDGILRSPALAPLVTFPLEVVVPEVRHQTPAVGQRATRPDSRLHGLGQTRYIDDMYFPGMLFARIKRAGIASAHIKSIDTSEAEAMPGVIAVITGRDIPCNSFGPSLKDQPVLADTRVFHAGDGVAAVAAISEQIATDALDKIKVEYEPLTPVLDPLESLKLETPGVHAPSANIYGSKVIKKGDVAKGFAESDFIFEGHFRTQMVEHVPLEPHATIAMWDANGRVSIYSTLGRITLGRADVARTNQALAIDPINTASVTEDMATAMHLHALGWTSVYHHEVLVHGLAPEDVRTMLSQRQRWATGTMQVFFSDNPMLLRGLTFGQRLMYLSTMTSYLNGFAAVIYVIAPTVFLVTGRFPIRCDSIAFFVYFMPFFLCCQALYLVAGDGAKGLWRGQQMSFALFPTWIKATVAGASAAFLGKTLSFAVTQKTKQATGSGMRHVVPQLVAICVLTVAGSYGAVQALAGRRPEFATIVTLLWVLADLALLTAMVRAARYRGPGDRIQSPFPTTVVEEVHQVVADIQSADSSVGASAVAQQRGPSTAPELVAAGRPGPFQALAGMQLRAAARFDAVAALDLRSQVAVALTGPSPIVLIDVSGVRTLTPSGVAVLVDLLRVVRSHGGDLRIFGASRGCFAMAHEMMALSNITRLHVDHAEAAYPAQRAG